MSLSAMKLFQKIAYDKIVLVFIVAIAFFLRVYELPSQFFSSETHNIYQGLRLHTLDLFNLSDHISQNFFKSFFGAIAGIRHVLSTYISSTIYGWLGIPIDQFWLLFFYVFLGTLCVVGVYWLGCKLADYRYGLVGALILAINTDQIFASRSDNAGLTVTSLVLACIIALYLYYEKPSWFRRTVLSFIIALIASMETMMMLPLIIIYQLILFVPTEATYSKKTVACFRYLFSKENILLWLPCFIFLLIHAYVYTRVGMSNIGLFGYMVYKAGVFNDLYGFWGHIALNLKMYSHQYFNPQFFYISLAVFFYLVSDYKKNNLGNLFLFSGIGFFYFFILFVISRSNANLNHLYICEPLNVLFIGSIWGTLLDSQRNIILPKGKLLIVCGLSLFFLVQTISQFYRVMGFQRLIHPLKSIGYYIQEYGGANPSAFLLLKCGQVHILANSEFYFATQVIDMEDSFNDPRRLFCMGTKSVDEVLSAYNLKDFDFYVAVYGYSGAPFSNPLARKINIFEKPEFKESFKDLRTPAIDLQIHDLLGKGVKSVATIKLKGTVVGEIFSRRDLPFKDMDIEEYDSLWDQKYGNIASLIKTRWIGQWSMWGNLWDFATGIQLGKK
jgi:hypothetical protein